jgi:hypothetical protein
MPSDLIRGWIPLRVKKTKTTIQGFGFDPIRTDHAPVVTLAEISIGWRET